MKACVMSSKVAKGTSKRTGKDFNAVVVHVVFLGEEGEKKECEAVWIDPEMLKGYLPQYGDVIEINYNRQGFVVSVNVLEGETCELVVAGNS